MMWNVDVDDTPSGSARNPDLGSHNPLGPTVVENLIHQNLKQMAIKRTSAGFPSQKFMPEGVWGLGFGVWGYDGRY
jgi:hypothetical protein